FFNETTIRSIYLYIPYFENIIHFLNKIEDINRITSIIIYNSPMEETYTDRFYILYFSKSIRIINKCCGQIKKDYFLVSEIGYFESLHHNSCLNRKIS